MLWNGKQCLQLPLECKDICSIARDLEHLIITFGYVFNLGSISHLYNNMDILNASLYEPEPKMLSISKHASLESKDKALECIK